MWRLTPLISLPHSMPRRPLRRLRWGLPADEKDSSEHPHWLSSLLSSDGRWLHSSQRESPYRSCSLPPTQRREMAKSASSSEVQKGEIQRRPMITGHFHAPWMSGGGGEQLKFCLCLNQELCRRSLFEECTILQPKRGCSSGRRKAGENSWWQAPQRAPKDKGGEGQY